MPAASSNPSVPSADQPPNPLQLAGKVAVGAQVVDIKFRRASFAIEPREVEAGGKKDADDPSLAIETDHELIARNGDDLEVLLTFGIRVGTPRKADNEQVVVRATYSLRYELPKDPPPSEEAVNAFARINGLYNAWPYFREFCSNATARLGLPAITLPVMTQREALALSGTLPKPKATVAASSDVTAKSTSTKKASKS